MLVVKPDFYDKFLCTADKCRHSCCIGWEIDIDEAAADRFLSLTGELGIELRRNISTDGQPHFILDSNERCPFLRGDGLCRLILELGEDCLCDICREHPRFYNCFPGREERGIGLCCEEAVRLFLDEKAPLTLIEEGFEEESDPLILLRGELLRILSDQDRALTERMDCCCERMGITPLPFDLPFWKEVFLSLERMDREWTDVLSSAQKAIRPEGIEYERIGEYLIYRHFASAPSIEEAALVLLFVFVSLDLLASLPGELENNLRLFSSEIEYSDENIGMIIDRIEEIIKNQRKHKYNY